MLKSPTKHQATLYLSKSFSQFVPQVTLPCHQPAHKAHKGPNLITFLIEDIEKFPVGLPSLPPINPALMKLHLLYH